MIHRSERQSSVDCFCPGPGFYFDFSERKDTRELLLSVFLFSFAHCIDTHTAHVYFDRERYPSISASCSSVSLALQQPRIKRIVLRLLVSQSSRVVRVYHIHHSSLFVLMAGSNS